MDSALLTQSYSEHLARLEHSYGEVLTQNGLDAIVIHSGSPKLRSAFDDQYWPLRVTPHFQHWLPLTAADCALVVRAGHRPKLVWLKEQNFWEKPPALEHDIWQSGFEIVHVGHRAEAQQYLPNTRVAFVGEDAQCAAEWGFNQADFTPKPLLTQLDALRVRKTAYEELCLAEANRRAAVGHTALAHAFKSGDASELDLHLAYLRATAQDDPQTPYKNIVALGANAATLHHISYGRTAPAGPAQSLLVDAGASFLGYCSDITRTYAKGNTAAASTFAGLVAGVERLQQQLCRDIRIDAPYEALHDRSHAYVAEVLRETGVLKLSAEEAVASGVTRSFFPHGLGHSLGLQCHDVGCASLKPRADNPFLRNTSNIAERQCFTIEPGIYFIDSFMETLQAGPHAPNIDWRLVSELSKLGGVRIEDDIVVVGGSSVTRNLTRQFLPA
jgi:Xaa-Pro dipeptidase